MPEGSTVHGRFTVTGTLQGDRTVILDESIPLAPMRVKLSVEPLGRSSKRPLLEVLAEIHQRQDSRGHVPPTQNQVDKYIKLERESWGE